MTKLPEHLHSRASDAEVIVVGAGPVGLALANILGMYNVRCTVVEARSELIDYPRGVGIDDESLRTFQGIGLIDRVLPHTTPNQIMRILNGKGRVLAEINPGATQFGWPRRNGFVQPAVDAELLAGTERFAQVDVLWAQNVIGYTEYADCVEVQIEAPEGKNRTLTAQYLVGCDGGRSDTRKQMGVSFEGTTSSTRWLVVDIQGDPLGIPNSHVIADPRRPYVSVAIAHGIRRFEFMVHAGESAEQVESPYFVQKLLARVIPDPDRVRIIRRRIYTHHSRIASSFRAGRVLVAGDAAHLMPVWQGQGYNSGIRDAVNLGWKLAAVVSGKARAELLETYDDERRAHALAMINLSTTVGRVIGISNRLGAAFRDAVATLASLVPPLKRSIVEMRFKPMPKYTKGAVVHAGAPARNSPVGRLFIQPRVDTRTASNVRLDDALGPWFAVVCWNNNPRTILDESALAIWKRLGARLVELRPQEQLHWLGHDHPDVDVIGDREGLLKSWFDIHDASVLVLRPDRFVAGACIAQLASQMTHDLVRALALTPGDTDADSTLLHLTQPLARAN